MTVTELKQRMTAAELADWGRYALEMGPLNLAWRIDFAIARSARRFLGGRMSDFMPYPPEKEREATPDDVLAVLKLAKKEPGDESSHPEILAR